LVVEKSSWAPVARRHCYGGMGEHEVFGGQSLGEALRAVDTLSKKRDLKACGWAL